MFSVDAAQARTHTFRYRAQLVKIWTMVKCCVGFHMSLLHLLLLDSNQIARFYVLGTLAARTTVLRFLLRMIEVFIQEIRDE